MNDHRIIIPFPPTVTTDDSPPSFLHFSVFPTALWDLANSRPVHTLMLSSNPFFCLSALSSSPFHCALQDGFGHDLQHDFAWVVDEADRSVLLALLQVSFLGSVMITDWFQGVSHSPVCQILFQSAKGIKCACMMPHLQHRTQQESCAFACINSTTVKVHSKWIKSTKISSSRFYFWDRMSCPPRNFVQLIWSICTKQWALSKQTNKRPTLPFRFVQRWSFSHSSVGYCLSLTSEDDLIYCSFLRQRWTYSFPALFVNM